MQIDPDKSLAADQAENDADECLCGMDQLDEEATLDEELPTATGGGEKGDDPNPTEDEDDVDGCDVDLTAENETPDEELPIAVGGYLR
jgi:hypothetical protein